MTEQVTEVRKRRIEFDIIELEDEKPAIGIKLLDDYMLLVELYKEKGYKKPFLRLTLTDKAGVIDGAEIPYDRLDKLKQPRFDPFRGSLKHALPKGVSITDLQSFIKVRVIPLLVDKYRKYLEKRRLEREAKIREILAKYGDRIEEISKDPVKHILEVANYYHIGDYDAKIQLIGCIASRLLPREKRLSAILQGPSSAGKNNLVKAFMRMTPKKWWTVLTRLTSRALDYMPKSLGRQILYIMEYEGLKEAAYSARITISEGELIVSYVRRNPKTGELETVNKRIRGTPVLITTTTSINVDPDMETRTMYINIDISEEQTRKIIDHVIDLESNPEAKKKLHEIKEKARLLRIWFRLLRKYDVIIPPDIANEVKQEFLKLPPSIRARRDIKKLLYFIEAFTVLHQHTREKKVIDGQEYLVADTHDWELVKEHVLPYIMKQTHGLTELHDKILSLIEKKKTITVKELAKELKISPDYARKLLNKLAESGFIEVNTVSRPYKYYIPRETEEEGENLWNY